MPMGPHGRDAAPATSSKLRDVAAFAVGFRECWEIGERLGEAREEMKKEGAGRKKGR